MTPFTSISTVFRKYADFDGRASRPEFWWFIVFSTLTQVALNAVGLAAIGGTGRLFAFSVGELSSSGITIVGIWQLAVLVPTLAATVRRLRDAGHLWSDLFWLLFPVVGIIVLIAHLAKPTAPDQVSTSTLVTG
jgi:uncharacterized membrane protein YhaH (DUF805 family)